MKQKLLLIIALFVAYGLQAQVVITLQLPPLGLTIKPQLWNMSLINTTGAAMNTQLTMVMSDAGTGQTVLTATTPPFQLPAGVKAVNATTVGTITYTVGVGYTIDANPNGFLPVGVYNVCYTVSQWTGNHSEQAVEECITVEVEPISPPQLIQPGDSDRIIFRRPFFTWLPPTPHTAFSNLLYDWMLVEVQTTQSAADAIQQNVPVLIQPNITFTSFQYPLSMPELDTGKLYAWRVTAKNNFSPIANSEVWCFSIQPYTTDTVRSTGQGYYAQMRREPDPSYVISGNMLRFLYVHELNSNAVQLKLTDISHTTHQLITLDPASMGVKYGPNYLQLELSEKGLTEKHMYLLEVTNDRNEHAYLKFEYRSLGGS